jgi:hypothetical protein
MGVEPYWYVVPFQTNVQAALDELRQREFQRGRYNPAVSFPMLLISPDVPGPGAKHRSIAEAQESADADGTRSILDIERIGDAPDYCTASPIASEVLESLFGTSQPTRAMVEERMDFLKDIERGHAVYIVLYSNGVPSELMFAGYSFD